MMNDVKTGNEAEFAAITLFLFLYCDNNLGKRDYNPDKQHQARATGSVTSLFQLQIL